MRRMMPKEQRERIINDLVQGRKSVVELSDATLRLLLNDIISSMRKNQ